MKLKDWLEKEKLTNVWLANKLKVTPQSVSNYKRDVYLPSALAIQEIERLTNGEVTKDDFTPKE